LYYVFDVYFAYPTAVNIEHPLRTYADTPGITIQFNIKTLWRRSKLQQKYPQIFEAYDKAVMGKNATSNALDDLNKGLEKKLKSLSIREYDQVTGASSLFNDRSGIVSCLLEGVGRPSSCYRYNITITTAGWYYFHLFGQKLENQGHLITTSSNTVIGKKTSTILEFNFDLTKVNIFK
jgi:hypothetical protein